MYARQPEQTLPVLEEWEASRARFSHDWLKNGMAIALGKVSNVLNGSVADPDALSELARLLDEWPEHREMASNVIACACDVLSPKRFFVAGLLSVLDGENRQFLEEIADSVWRRLQQPEFIVQQADRELHELDVLSIRMADALKAAQWTIHNDLFDIQSLVNEMRQAVARLSGTMTELGHCRRI